MKNAGKAIQQQISLRLLFLYMENVGKSSSYHYTKALIDLHCLVDAILQPKYLNIY